jgi:hypothetical protein
MSSRYVLAGFLVLAAAAAAAHQVSAPSRLSQAPKAFVVERALPPPPRDVAELRFGDIFKTPVGPLGLEAGARLAELDGKRVRLVGYMVQQEQPGTGAFVLSPLPLTLGSADEGLADEMPPTALLVQLPESARFSPAHMPGLIQVTGRLQVGRVESAAIPGRVFPARVELDPRLAKVLAKANK